MKRIQSHNGVQNLFFRSNPEDPIYVCDVGYHKTPPKHCYGPAVRPYYLLHLIESGKGEMLRNGKSTPLSKGQAFLIEPGEVTTYRADETEPWSYYWISFYGSFAKSLVEKTISDLFFPYRQSGLLALKTALETENNHTVDGLNALFAVLRAIKTDTQPEQENAVDTAVKYLENNYFHAIKIEEVADMLGYSRAHFTTLFTDSTGLPPYEYLTLVRLEKAKDFLKNSALSIEEIAYSVGFSSLVRFSELFKKRIGVSPKQYRNSFK